MHVAPAPLPLHADRRPDAAGIERAARELEGVFAQMLIKSMRDASFGDSLFPGENQLYRDLYDQQLAKSMTAGPGLGLATVIARQLGAGNEDAPGLDTRLASGNARAGMPFGEVGTDRSGALRPGATGTDESARSPAAAAYAAMQAFTAKARSAMGDDAADGPTAATEAGRSPMDAFVERLMERARPVAGIAGAALSRLPGAPMVSGVAKAATSAVSAAAEGFAPRSPEAFVASVWPHAQRAAEELGVDPRALVAQAALETGWGRRLIQRGDGGSSNNLFGIKATGWSGERASASTHEYRDGVRRTERADFRSYASPAESFADYVRLLKQNPRYQQALEAGGDVRRFAQGLQRAGYATDPGYADKITAITNGPTLGRALSAILKR